MSEEEQKPYFASDQEDAYYSVLASKKNNDSFITGGAGVGKSFLTSALRAANPAGAVLCATTGQAAQVINGRTLHSFIGMVPYKGLSSSRSVEERICACKTLFIDEISMLSDVIYDLMMTRFEDLNYRPQLVLIGDFHQLPPVDAEEGVSHQFAFKSQYWKDIKILQLTQQHRQSDMEFTTALNHVRVGRFTPEVVNLLASRNVGQLPDDCTMIFPLRSMVSEVNRKHVLDGAGYPEWFTAELWERDGVNAPVDKNRFRFEKDLHLKPGNRIIMLNNDQMRRWNNGSTGVIHSVKSPSFVKVVLDNGFEGTIERETEKMYAGDGSVRGTLKQFPLVVAKALTIHKAQGLSLDRVGVCMDHHFEAGMTYVALSRARTKEGLFLKGMTTRFRVHPDALEFYRNN